MTKIGADKGNVPHLQQPQFWLNKSLHLPFLNRSAVSPMDQIDRCKVLHAAPLRLKQWTQLVRSRHAKHHLVATLPVSEVQRRGEQREEDIWPAVFNRHMRQDGG